MAITLDQTIAQKQHSWLAPHRGQPDFLGSVAVLLACIFLSFATDSFATTKNLYNITRNVTFVAIIALGMTLVIITGGIDLSVGSVLVPVQHGAGRHDACRLRHRGRHRRRDRHCPDHRRLQRRADRLSRLSALRRDARHAVDRAAAWRWSPPATRWFSSSAPITTSCWRSAAAPGCSASPTRCSTWSCWRCITGFVLRWTRFGRHVYAIGGNEHAATLTGVPVKPIKVAVYMISALSAGIAGIIQTGWLGAITTNIGAGLELQVIAAAVIGGANLAGGIGTAFGAHRRRGADRSHPQQPRPARHQRLLAGHLHRRRDHPGGAVRPHPQFPPERIAGRRHVGAFQPEGQARPRHRLRPGHRLCAGEAAWRSMARGWCSTAGRRRRSTRRSPRCAARA